MFPNSYIVIDVETTGLKFNGTADSDRVIEFAALEIAVRNGEPEIVSQWSTLINPERVNSALEINGISDDELASAPLFVDVADEIAGWLGAGPILIYNAPFDLRALWSEFKICGLESDWIPELPATCVLKSARATVSALHSYTLHAVASHFSIDSVGAHRAIVDCWTTARVAEALRGFAKAKEARRVAQLATVDAAPATDVLALARLELGPHEETIAKWKAAAEALPCDNEEQEQRIVGAVSAFSGLAKRLVSRRQ